MPSLRAFITPAQNAWCDEVLGPVEVLENLSWGLVSTVVLHVKSRDTSVEYIVKASHADDHHIVREIEAHVSWTGKVAGPGTTPQFVVADSDLRVIVTRYLPGELMQDSSVADDPDLYRQAGEFLRGFHALSSRIDNDYNTRAIERTRAWLAGEHRIPREVHARVEEILESSVSTPAILVPTHGDFHERNWLHDGGILRVIDFGRFAFRPAETDLLRMARRAWVRSPELERAFLEGYGSDPRVPPSWQLEVLREAVATAAWAYKVGDEAFEAEGLASLIECTS